MSKEGAPFHDIDRRAQDITDLNGILLDLAEKKGDPSEIAFFQANRINVLLARAAFLGDGDSETFAIPRVVVIRNQTDLDRIVMRDDRSRLPQIPLTAQDGEGLTSLTDELNPYEVVHIYELYRELEAAEGLSNTRVGVRFNRQEPQPTDRPNPRVTCMTLQKLQQAVSRASEA